MDRRSILKGLLGLPFVAKVAEAATVEPTPAIDIPSSFPARNSLGLAMVRDENGSIPADDMQIYPGGSIYFLDTSKL